jgi:fructoselysine 6-kinase
MFPGGNCLNLSIFARRFGAQSAYVGAIGEDDAGRTIRAALTQEGVNVTRLREVAGATAYCRIGHRPNGDRMFLDFDLGVSMFEPGEADFAFVHGFDAVHIGQSSGLDAHVPRFAAQTRLSYDFSTRRDRAHRTRLAPLCFLASFSAGDLSLEECGTLMAEVLAAGARWCLLTRGEKGAMLGSGTDRFMVPAAPATVVDTLGAGDAFIARTLVGLLGEEAPAEFLAAAAQAAAQTCAHLGATGHGAPMSITVRRPLGTAEAV